MKTTGCVPVSHRTACVEHDSQHSEHTGATHRETTYRLVIMLFILAARWASVSSLPWDWLVAASYSVKHGDRTLRGTGSGPRPSHAAFSAQKNWSNMNGSTTYTPVMMRAKPAVRGQWRRTCGTAACTAALNDPLPPWCTNSPHCGSNHSNGTCTHSQGCT